MQVMGLGWFTKCHDITFQSGEPGSEQRPNLIGQMVGNLKENDNPRFTLNELKDVLTERNTLKSKLIEIEEELTYYKTK